ncbi:PIG-L family deacetylase [Candidatus Parcubacteria bacterium]|nr:PIG-L family deacetylase [Patescibacteria group bacterium]MBU4309251.1 PIG-L family deacetylase [Patescibacteria group bacterium]MBU4432480.1 PIG-L family deacetylase [Patescibacteria group bacterium]MBU4577612.1 PIG-L family deacetylase [Patescibacteria group bacterium]MCG2697299.1 PIG-L family deacetylase [Candidatus Parcubacteria bacterium]
MKITDDNKIMDRILAIGPHPDDIELGCFGTLAKYHANGSKIGFVVLSFGGAKSKENKRKKEAIASAKLLSAKTYFGELPDTKISDGVTTISIIEKAINDFKPTLVIVNSTNDTHQDHRNASRAAISAARFVPAVLFYQTPSSTRDFNPKFFVDISNHIDIKMQAVQLHVSQGENVYMADRAIKGLAEFLGFQIYQGGKHYEGFEIHQLIV